MRVEFDEHPSKVSALRAGAHVVHPDAAAEDCTVWFAAGSATDGQVQWEGLLARRLAEDRALICGVPFWIRGLAFGDAVGLIESGEGAPVATEVVTRGGYTTLRVFFEGHRESDDRWQQLVRDLEVHDCWFDVRSPRFLAIATPIEQFAAVHDQLAKEAERGTLHLEVGRGPE